MKSKLINKKILTRRDITLNRIIMKNIIKEHFGADNDITSHLKLDFWYLILSYFILFYLCISVCDKNIKSFDKLKFKFLVYRDYPIGCFGCLGDALFRSGIRPATLNSSPIGSFLLFLRLHYLGLIIVQICVIPQELKLIRFEFTLILTMGCPLWFLLADW